MSKRIKRKSRARDKRADIQLQETIQKSDLPPEHSETHHAGAGDEITPSNIGAETPTGAQSKVDEHEDKENPHSDSASATNLNDHIDSGNPHSNSASETDLNDHIDSGNPHSDSQGINSGTDKPSSPSTGEMFFDTDLGQPIWYDGTDWVDAEGSTI
ncbi:MAG: hypothetical protein ACOC80_15315 [Petrotogales bacterium]